MGGSQAPRKGGLMAAVKKPAPSPLSDSHLIATDLVNEFWPEGRAPKGAHSRLTKEIHDAYKRGKDDEYAWWVDQAEQDQGPPERDEG